MATTLYDLISIKLQLGDETRRLKLPLKDLTPSTLPGKLRGFLNIPPSKSVVFERYSDSAAAYITLDPSNQAVYKQLYRAAKAKAKLRIKVIVTDNTQETKVIPVEHVAEEKEIPTIKTAPSVASSVTIKVKPAPEPEVVEPVKKEEAPATKAPWKSWTGHLTSFVVQCNECNEAIPGTHYHCDICDNNDFDLCSKCVDSGVHCDVDDHYLIKRNIVDGKILNSTTYKFMKKFNNEEKKMPGTFQSDVKEPVFQPEATRTCNCCVISYPESRFITCVDCEDYDLCEKCFLGDKHGHHPGHSFEAVDTNIILGQTKQKILTGGLRHYASCDGCDKNIFGVRHKCLNCPDFDFCSNCILSARHIHPGHRFVRIYEHIGFDGTYKPLHDYIRCDGPLCKGKTTYIRGHRYKCAVCPDTDFCANCEAYPNNTHCRTHPLIKLRTPVRNVSVTTFGEDPNGEITSTMGDKPPAKKSKSTETVSSKSSNAATQVQTIAEIKPASPKVEALLQPEEKVVSEPQSPKEEELPKPQLQAWFVSDTLVDHTRVEPEQLYTQTWTLINPSALTWPAGCTVCFTGGDNMLNISREQPSSTSEIEAAVRSNTIEHEVKQGEKVQFSVTIKTPKVPGGAVSYWRLKTADGTPFGHKLWCDVFVKDPATKQVQPEPTPVQESIKEEVKEEPQEETKLETSQMVFPKLEKESPSSSIIAEPAPKAPSVTGDEVEFLDDLEQLTISDADESEDAFLTDEEYEMLDTDSAFEEAANGKK